jgi:sigma-E factor negative regulatory protein RseA
MEKDQKNRQHISELMDSELDPQKLPSVMSHLTQHSGREQWDTYHRIGDSLRSVETVDTLSENFSQRMAARLMQEPAYLRPPKRPVVNVKNTWQAIAAVAAVVTGFLIAPTLFDAPTQTSVPLSMSIPESSEQAPVVLADASNQTPEQTEQQKYLLWHQNSTSSLYALRMIAHPVSSVRHQLK